MSWHSRVHEIKLVATLQHQSECLIRSLVPITVVAHVARQVVIRVKVVSTVQVRFANARTNCRPKSLLSLPSSVSFSNGVAARR